MKLGVVTHVDLGWSANQFDHAARLGVDLVRDAMRWDAAEPAAGVYSFSDPRTRAPEEAAARGMDIILLFAVPAAHVDGGATPYTDAGRAAFADYVAATLRRYPEVGAIEIGNEFNSDLFVRGPVLEAGYAERDEAYAALLAAVAERLTTEFPTVAVLGGATHSIPLDYLGAVFDHGALDDMDGVAVHPYSTPPEEIGAHLALLRQAMGEDEKPVYVTEFGGPFDDPVAAADHLVKMTAAMAAADVAAATWYALHEQPGYPNANVITRDGAPTPLGEAFAFLRGALLPLGAVEDVSPDDFTHAYRFGDRGMALWGLPRSVALDPGVRAFDAQGRLLEADALSLDLDSPLILLSAERIAFGDGVSLGAGAVVADVRAQFDVALNGDGPWTWLSLRENGAAEPLTTMGGGAWRNEPWRPYLGSPWLRPLKVTEADVTPVDFGPGKAFSVVERYTAPTSMIVSIDGRWTVSDASRDGVTLDVLLNGVSLAEARILGGFDLDLDRVALRAGDALDFVVGPGETPDGDATARDITIRRVAPPLEFAPFRAEGQDGGAVEVDAAGVRLLGNAWKQVDADGAVGADSLLFADVSLERIGEVHGLGFFDGESIEAARVLQFGGSQRFGVAAEQIGGAASGLGLFGLDALAEGGFDRLVFINDEDRPRDAAARFDAVALGERLAGEPGPVAIGALRVLDPHLGWRAPDAAEHARMAYAAVEAAAQAGSAERLTLSPAAMPGRHGEGSGVSAADGLLTLTGNAWVEAAVDVFVTDRTVAYVSADVRAAGEIVGFGLVVDGEIVEASAYRVAGSQAWGALATPAAETPDGMALYRIALGEAFTGRVDGFAFFADDDARAAADVTLGPVAVVEARPVDDLTAIVFDQARFYVFE